MKLADFLMKNRITRRDFATAAGLSEALLHKITSGGGSVTLDTALRIHIASRYTIALWELSPNADSILGEVKPFTLVEDGKKPTKKKNEQDKQGNVEAQDVR